MDVDNGPGDGSGGGGGDIDIEQSLLHQFSCMGTTDKEDLIKELQRVLGFELNYATATFFLDMNNWNLQSAICSYFDCQNHPTLPSMALQSDPIANECENVEPNINFVKVWNVYNNGNEAWPSGCHVQSAGGDTLGGERLTVPALQPGEHTVLFMNMYSPSVPGMYQSKWRLCTPGGTFFGDPLWAIITVVEEGAVTLTRQLSHFSELGASPNSSVSMNPFNQNRAGDEHMQGPPPSPDLDKHMC